MDNERGLIDRAIESAQCRIYRLKATSDGASLNHQKKADCQKELMEITIKALEYYRDNVDDNFGWKYDEKPDVKYGIFPLFFVDMKRKEGKSSFRAILNWDSIENCWKWDNGKRLSDKYEVLAWQRLKYPPESK